MLHLPHMQAHICACLCMLLRCMGCSVHSKPPASPVLRGRRCQVGVHGEGPLALAACCGAASNTLHSSLLGSPGSMLTAPVLQTPRVLVCGWGDHAWMGLLLRELDRGPAALPKGSEVGLPDSEGPGSSEHLQLQRMTVHAALRQLQQCQGCALVARV